MSYVTVGECEDCDPVALLRAMRPLGAVSKTKAQPLPSYYAKPSTLKWSSADMKAMHDQCVAIDLLWHQIMDVWEQIPGMDFALSAAKVKHSDVVAIENDPCPFFSQLALILEAGFGGRPIDDAFKGVMNNAGATLAAISGAIGVLAAIFGVVAGIAAVGGIASLGITTAMAAPLGAAAAGEAVIAAIVGVIAAVCFGIAGQHVDCGQFKSTVQTSGGAFGHDVSDGEAASACKLLNTHATKVRSDALAKAKIKSKQKTLLAMAIAKSIRVTYAVLFTAAKKKIVNTWINACFAAATSGAPQPVPSAQVIAAIPGARALGTTPPPQRATTASNVVDTTPLAPPPSHTGLVIGGAFVLGGLGLLAYARRRK